MAAGTHMGANSALLCLTCHGTAKCARWPLKCGSPVSPFPQPSELCALNSSWGWTGGEAVTIAKAEVWDPELPLN
ncbi:hypothetical protein XELAEV_18039599mg [Xenopus laevis]|uniref:Uncharacterized protein n=1 Tax=Xenopus laevis TaxID=8355 RepID=A0A974H8A0_XENLA|nr:hypothetical protein XELAEV_18039599mg [Xenopus laevis]